MSVTRPAPRVRAWAAIASVVTAALTAAVLAPLSSATPAQAATSDACGATVLKADGTPWRCTFVDTFSGSALDTSKWVPVETAKSGFTSGGECFVNSSRNVAVGRGVLTLTVRKEPKPLTCASPRGAFATQFTAGYVSTWSKFAQTYGRFEFRAKFPSASKPGLHSALWLYPSDPTKYGPWPASGEIDVAEFYSSYPDRAVPYVHYNGDKADPNATNTECFVAAPDTFHTYEVEWTPQTITVRFDGKVCIADDWRPTDGLAKPAPFDQPFYLNLTQALGILDNKYVAGSTPLPASMQVDHVKVWS